jgi:tetratricopeptide (TPR) repeat protein
VKAALAGLAVAWGLALPSWFHLPTGIERWLVNPRQQTGEGLADLGRGEADEARRHFETALRLAPDEPKVRYNAGTGALLADDPEAAVELLGAAAAAASPRLAPSALYNLGNARLAAGDAPGAIAAYEECLRRAPGFVDAKFNLELALAEAARRRPQRQPDREAPEGSSPGEEESSADAGGPDPPGEERRDEAPPEPSGRQGDREGPSRTEQERQGGARMDALPRFQEQPDMTAEQAAAILEAVENLEREQRRRQAAQRARQRGGPGKDW